VGSVDEVVARITGELTITGLGKTEATLLLLTASSIILCIASLSNRPKSARDLSKALGLSREHMPEP